MMTIAQTWEDLPEGKRAVLVLPQEPHAVQVRRQAVYEPAMIIITILLTIVIILLLINTVIITLILILIMLLIIAIYEPAPAGAVAALAPDVLVQSS